MKFQHSNDFYFVFFLFCATCIPSMLRALWAFRTVNVTLTPFDKAALEAHAFALRIADGSHQCGATIVEHANCIHAFGIFFDPHRIERLQCRKKKTTTEFSVSATIRGNDVILLIAILQKKNKIRKSTNRSFLYNLSAPQIYQIDCHYSDLMECRSRLQWQR